MYNLVVLGNLSYKLLFLAIIIMIQDVIFIGGISHAKRKYRQHLFERPKSSSVGMLL